MKPCRNVLTTVAVLLLAGAPPMTQAGEVSADGETVAAYGAACAAAIGDIPAFDCRDGEIIPITVNGKEERDQVPSQCDHPAQSGEDDEWPAGRCVPFSRTILLREGTVQATAICRRKRLRPINDKLFE